MKRFPIVLLFLGVGSMLPGCPIYDDESECSADDDCPLDYVCDSLVGSCRPNECTAPTQCPADQTCSSSGKCIAQDCSWPEVGCVAGYVCSTKTGVWECVKKPSVPGQGGAGGAGGGEPGSGGAGVNSGGTASTGGTVSTGGVSAEAGAGGRG